MDEFAIQAYLGDVLSSVVPGSTVESGNRDLGWDLVARVNGSTVLIDVKSYSLVDGARAAAIARQLRRPEGTSLLIVADRLVDSARAEFVDRQISWLDLRGHLRLQAPGVLIDTDVLPYGGTARRQVRGRVPVATAADLLLDPERTPSVRDIARRIDAAPSSVSVALRDFAADGLLSPDRTPDPKALFDWLTDAWRPVWFPCELKPDPGPGMRNPALALGFTDAADAGWGLTGDRAALALGARFALNTAAPSSFYVPHPRALRMARSVLRDAPARNARTWVALAPVIAACTERIDVGRQSDEHWFTTRPLFVALDLAQDTGRGAEILASFEPSGASRVW